MGPESLPSVGSRAEDQAGVKLGSPSGDSLSPWASVSRSVREPTTLPAQAFPVGSLLKSSVAWLLALLYLLGSRLGVAGGGREVARAGTSQDVGGPGAQLQRSLHFPRCPGPQPQWHSRWAWCPCRDVGQPGQGRCGGPWPGAQRPPKSRLVSRATLASDGQQGGSRLCLLSHQVDHACQGGEPKSQCPEGTAVGGQWREACQVSACRLAG